MKKEGRENGKKEKKGSRGEGSRGEGSKTGQNAFWTIALGPFIFFLDSFHVSLQNVPSRMEVLCLNR